MKQKILSFFSWLMIGVIVSALYQLLLNFPKSEAKNYGPLWGWGENFQILIGGLIMGIIAGVLLFFLDSFALRKKIEDKYYLLVARCVFLLCFVIIISFLQKKFF